MQTVYDHLISKEVTDKILAVINSELGIKSVLTTQYFDDDKQCMVKNLYPFFGSGCGFAVIEYDRRNKMSKALFDGREVQNEVSKYKSYLSTLFSKEVKDYYTSVGFPLTATLGQNMVINGAILTEAVEYLKKKYKITTKCYVRTIID